MIKYIKLGPTFEPTDEESPMKPTKKPMRPKP
jgi:hypothetical protein